MFLLRYTIISGYNFIPTYPREKSNLTLDLFLAINIYFSSDFLVTNPTCFHLSKNKPLHVPYQEFPQHTKKKASRIPVIAYRTRVVYVIVYLQLARVRNSHILLNGPQPHTRSLIAANDRLSIAVFFSRSLFPMTRLMGMNDINPFMDYRKFYSERHNREYLD